MASANAALATSLQSLAYLRGPAYQQAIARLPEAQKTGL